MTGSSLARDEIMFLSRDDWAKCVQNILDADY